MAAAEADTPDDAKRAIPALSAAQRTRDGPVPDCAVARDPVVGLVVGAQAAHCRGAPSIMNTADRKLTGSRSTPRILVVVGAAVGCAALAIALLLWWFRGSSGHADPNDQIQVALGRSVYDAQCARCHGDRLQGQPDWRERLPNGRLPAPPHDETGHTWHHPDRVLFAITKRGLRPPNAPEGYESDMPAYQGVLSDAEIWAVIAFLKSSWPPVIRSRQQRITDQAGG
jgi:mono/diheme cytochrome c family protein